MRAVQRNAPSNYYASESKELKTIKRTPELFVLDIICSIASNTFQRTMKKKKKSNIEAKSKLNFLSLIILLFYVSSWKYFDFDFMSSETILRNIVLNDREFVDCRDSLEVISKTMVWYMEMGMMCHLSTYDSTNVNSVGINSQHLQPSFVERENLYRILFVFAI